MGGTSETVSENVIHSVAAEAVADPLDLPPLYDTIDPDALDASINAITDGNIQFEYAGYAVTVNSDETVDVNAIPDSAASRSASAADD